MNFYNGDYSGPSIFFLCYTNKYFLTYRETLVQKVVMNLILHILVYKSSMFDDVGKT